MTYTLRDYLNDHDERTVLWVEKDLNVAEAEMRRTLGDMILKRGYRGSILTLEGGHKIMAVTPLAQDRMRGFISDAVYIGNYSAYAGVSEAVKWTTLSSEDTRWFNSDGELENPYS